MAKKKKSDEFTYSIEQYIAPIKESDSNDWVKGVARIKWGDNPTTIDIRNMNLANDTVYRGVSLSDEEADNLVKILLDEGYGNLDDIIDTVKTRKSRFSYMSVEEARDDNDGMLFIDTSGFVK